jgi:lysophospholipase L1-like esterase
VAKPAFYIALLCFYLSIPLSAQEQWETTIQQFEKSDQDNQPEPGAVLFVGSSSIAMWKDMADYFPEHRVLNRGFGGSEFSDLIYYADRVIYPYQPSKIFIYEGDNDLAAGDSPKSVLKKAKKLRKMIAKNLGRDIPAIFIAPKPSVARWNLKTEYEILNAMLKKYADKKANTEFADVWTPALDENGEVYKHIFLEDNLHMNADGYAIWKQVLQPYIDQP